MILIQQERANLGPEQRRWKPFFIFFTEHERNKRKGNCLCRFSRLCEARPDFFRLSLRLDDVVIVVVHVNTCENGVAAAAARAAVDLRLNSAGGAGEKGERKERPWKGKMPSAVTRSKHPLWPHAKKQIHFRVPAFALLCAYAKLCCRTGGNVGSCAKRLFAGECGSAASGASSAVNGHTHTHTQVRTFFPPEVMHSCMTCAYEALVQVRRRQRRRRRRRPRSAGFTANAWPVHTRTHDAPLGAAHIRTSRECLVPCA